MLKFNNSDKPNERGPDDGTIPADPNDPNSPNIPVPGGGEPTSPVEDIPHSHPVTPAELEAIGGAAIRGSVTGLTDNMIAELNNQGISADQIKRLAVQWGVNAATAAGIWLSRNTAQILNNTFNRIFPGSGGGSGGLPPIYFMPANMSDGGSGPGSGGGGYGGGGSGPIGPLDPRLHQHLDTNSKPGEVILNIGIKNPGYVPYYKEYSQYFTYPLHFTCALPTIPSSTNYLLGKFTTSAVILRFIERVGRSVNYQLDFSIFSTANITSYFNAIMEGLAIYYFYESVFAYSYGKTNTNDGLVWFRRNIDSTTQNELVVLRSTLAALPIPPNMVQFVYWMYQNWQYHSLADSPVAKICPLAINTTTWLPDPSRISTIYTTLNTGTNRSITATLVKAFDDWYKADLPPSSNTLEHNADWTTLFANLPGVSINTGYTHRFPYSSSNSSSIVYQSYTDELDGAVIAMCGVYQTTNNEWAPTLMTPVVTTNGTNEFNRVNWMGNTNKFRNPYADMGATLQRIDTYISTPTYTSSAGTFGPITSVHNVFSERLFGISIDSICEAGVSMLQWLLNFDEIEGLASKAGGVLPTAPRGNALSKNNASSQKGGGWTRRKERKGQSPEIDKMLGEL